MQDEAEGDMAPDSHAQREHDPFSHHRSNKPGVMEGDRWSWYGDGTLYGRRLG